MSGAANTLTSSPIVMSCCTAMMSARGTIIDPAFAQPKNILEHGGFGRREAGS
jgi:hypothetical protein